MEKKDRYRNGIGVLALCRLALGCLLLLAAGVGFVLVRNDHVLVGQEIRGLEERVKVLDREIEMWEVRIAGIHDRQEIRRRLRWVQSDLYEIEPAKVIRISPAGKVDGGPESKTLPGAVRDGEEKEEGGQ